MVNKNIISSWIRIVAILFSLSQIYFAWSGIITTDVAVTFFYLAFVIILKFLIKQYKKDIRDETIVPLDIILVFLAIGSLIYFRYHYYVILLSALAAITGSNPFKTDFLALRLSKGLYTVTILMVFTPIMLNRDFTETILAVLTGI